MKLINILFISLFFTVGVSAQSWKWGREAKVFNPGAGQGDPLGNHCVATDINGNVYGNGMSIRKLIFGKDTLDSPTLGQYLYKYDKNGNPIWARVTTAGVFHKNTTGTSLSTDRSSNIYTTGFFSDTLIFAKDTLIKGSYWSFDSYLAKYDVNGNLIWARQSICPPSDSSWCQGNDVVTDSSGNIYVTGYFEDTATFGPYTLTSKGGGVTQVFLVKYDPKGNVVWAKQTTGRIMLWSSGNSIAIDASGNLYLTGEFTDTLQFGTHKLYPTNFKKNYPNVYVVKYDKNGNVIWAKQSIALGRSAAEGFSVSVDALYNIYITGEFTGTAIFGRDTINSPNNFNNVFLIRYDTSGTVHWAKCGNSIVPNSGWSGSSLSSDTLPQGGGFLLAGGGTTIVFNTDTFKNGNYLFQFDTTGQIICSTAYSEGGEDDQDGVITDRSGKYIYLSGDIWGPCAFGPDSLLYGGDVPFVARWQGCCSMPVHVSPIDTIVCMGDSVTLTASGAANYYWSPSKGLNKDTGSSVRSKITAKTTYLVEGKIPGCNGYAAVTINVHPAPNVSALPHNDTICKGQSIVLKGTGALTYLWSPSLGLSCTVCPDPNANPNATVTYRLIGTDSNGCKDSSKVTVFVKPAPVPVVTALPANDSICKGDSIALKASGGNSYSWAPVNSTGSSIWVKPLVNTTYSVSVSNGSCSADTTITITIVPPFQASITPDTTICKGDKVTLVATGGGTYKWSTNSTENLIVVTPTQTTTYSVTVTKGCKSSASTTVYIDVPALSACCNDTIVQGTTVNLDASGSNSYLWIPDSALSCDKCPDPVATPSVTTTYTVIGTDSLGCRIEQVITILVETGHPCFDFSVPNVFTPTYAGAQGINNVFYINTKNTSAWSIIIYDRWGKEMFKSDNPNQYWNGNTENGGEAPAGVYYYIINGTCNNRTYKKDGFVQVIR